MNPIPHRIHGTGIIYLHEWFIFMVNVGKYTSPMDPMGYRKKFFFFFRGSLSHSLSVPVCDLHRCLGILQRPTLNKHSRGGSLNFHQLESFLKVAIHGIFMYFLYVLQTDPANGA